MFDCRLLTLVTALVAWVGVAYSQTEPQPNNERRAFSAQQGGSQPTPPPNFLSQEQITKAVADGIDAAAKEYETRHPAPPPDNSGWWFNFFLVAFTGGLAVVGAGQCYLIFWTLRATQTAADAADASAKAITVVERAYVYPIIDGHGPIEQCIQTALDSEEEDVPAAKTVQLFFRFKNFGKTPAILKSAFVGFGAAKVGALTGVSLPVSVLASLDDTGGPLTCGMWIGITRRQAKHIVAYTGHICFEGEVIFDDIWGNEHTTKFYFVWDKEPRRMRLTWVETTTKQKDERGPA